MINFNKVSKKFDDFWVLKDINLEIKEGEFISIIGPNGSGKSTLVRCINGLYKPEKGIVSIDGMDTNEDNLYEIRKKVGFVFQNPDNQIVSTTIEDEIAFGLENLQLNPDIIEKKVEKALKFINMLSYKNKLTTNLSGGQKQLISFASIIAMDTKYMVFDEPTSLVDNDSRKKIIKMIKKLKKNKKTIIYISHFMDEIFLSDKVVVLNEGKVVFYDTPFKLLHNDEILNKIGFPLPLHLKLAKRYNIKVDNLDYYNILLKIQELIK